MPTQEDDTYRENLRAKLGLGKKVMGEEVPAGIDENPNDEETLPPTSPIASPEAKEHVNHEAEAILNEVLQFVDEKEKEASDSSPKLMLKSLYLHLSKNKTKILQKMADDAQ